MPACLSIIDPRRVSRDAAQLFPSAHGDWSNSNVSMGDALFGMLLGCQIT